MAVLEVYNMSILSQNINNNDIFTGLLITMQDPAYSLGLFQFIVLILFFAFIFVTLKYANVSPVKQITISIFTTLILAILFNILGAVESFVVTIIILILVLTIIYQKTTDN